MDAIRTCKKEREEEERGRGITVYTKILYVLSSCSWVQSNIIRRAWCISKSGRIIMIYFKIDEL